MRSGSDLRLRTGVLALLLASVPAAEATPVPPRPEAAGTQDASAYLELIARYRREDERREAVRELVTWPRSSVRDAVRGLDSQSVPPVSRLAAMLLHGDAGILARWRGDAELSDLHFQAGLTIVGDLAGGDSERSARRWLLAIALFQASQGDVGSVTELLDQALDRFPDDPQLLLVSGQVAEYLATPEFRGWAPSRKLEAGRRRGSEEAMRQSSEMRARLSEAEADYRRALDADSSLLEARLHLGRVQHVRGQLSEARESLEAVSSAQPSDASLAYMANLLLGGVHESAGELERAAACYREAVETDPSSEVAVLALAHATHRLGRRPEAAEMVRTLLSKRGRRPHTDGWWAFRMGPFADGDRVEPILREIRAEIAE